MNTEKVLTYGVVGFILYELLFKNSCGCHDAAGNDIPPCGRETLLSNYVPPGWVSALANGGYPQCRPTVPVSGCGGGRGTAGTFRNMGGGPSDTSGGIPRYTDARIQAIRQAFNDPTWFPADYWM